MSDDTGNRDVDLTALRWSYELAGLTEGDLAPDWLTQFRAWLADAVAAALPEPNAMVLATADQDGRPSARTVLLREVGRDGFVCYTNLRSRKGVEATTNPHVSLVFPWIALQRQVVVVGSVERVPDRRAEAYWATRPRGHQVGAAASPQSQVVPSRRALEERAAAVVAAHPEGTPVPRPVHWGGLLVRPESVEFWQGRRDRLHDRLRFRRTGAEWQVERLAP